MSHQRNPQGSWVQLGICATLPPAVFFPDPFSADELRAKSVCASCPVQTDCRRHAYLNDERHGVWGGTSQHDRKVTKRQARRGLVRCR